MDKAKKVSKKKEIVINDVSTCEATKQMLDGIPDVTEIVLENTGHMLRFTNPITYANIIESFFIKKIV